MRLFGATLLLLVLGVGFAATQPADALLRRADSLEAQHRYRQAASVLDQLVLRDPTNVAYLDRRSRLLELLDEHIRAFIDLERADHLDGPRADRHYRRAFMLLRMKNLVEAREQIQAGLKLAPQRAGFYGLLAEVELTANQPAKAEAALRKALKLDPNDPMSRHVRARIDLLNKRRAEARAGFEGLVRDDPGNALSRINLSILVYQDEQDAEAAAQLLLPIRDPRYAPSAGELLRELYQKTIATEPDAPRQLATRYFIESYLDQRPCLTSHHVWLVERWAAAGDTARARQHTERLRQVLTQCPIPDRANDYNLVAWCLAEDCNDEAAALAYIDSLERVGGYTATQAQSSRLGVFQLSKNYVALEELLDDLFHQHPRDLKLLNLRVDNLVRLERIDRAVEVLGLALAANDTCAYCYFKRGLLRLELPDSAGSLADLLAAGDLGFRSLGLDNNIGLLRWQYARDSVTALADFDRSITHYPEFAYAYNNRGWLLFLLGKTQEALAAVNRSLLIDSQNAQAYVNRAKIHDKLGHPTEEICADLHTALTILKTEASSGQRTGPSQRQLLSELPALLKAKCPAD